MAETNNKFADMEAVRGFASLGVVVYHFLHGFVPSGQSLPLADTLGLVAERPVRLALVNGPFMVSVFFVLSSFVLTYRLVREPNARMAAVAVFKRFPRLLPLTFIGAVLPAILFAFGLMANEEVAAAIKSPWLELSGGVKVSDRWPEPSIYGSITDALSLFRRGLSQYNSALWTMKYELIGSVFALSTSLLLGVKPKLFRDTFLTLLIAGVGLWFHALVFVCAVTVLLTKYVCRPGFALGRAASLALILGGLLLGSTYEVFPKRLLHDDWMRVQVLRADWLIHGAGAMLVLVGVRGWINSPLQTSSIGRQLGRISFPMYVIHLPVFASMASMVILFLGYDWISVTLAFLLSMGLIFLLSIPVAYIDEWWVRKLNNIMKLIFNKTRIVHRP